MIKLHDNETASFLVSISEEQLQFLINALEESQKDQDDYLSCEMLALREQQGAHPGFLPLLRRGVEQQGGG